MTSNTSLSPSSSDSSNKELILKNANLSVLEFISGQQVIEKLQEADDFIHNLSPFDLEARSHHSSSSTLQDYFKLIARHILHWNEASIQSIISCVDYINTTCLNQLKLLTYPSRIFLVLTDGQDENNAAYCRHGNVIVIPQVMIISEKMRRILIHELFHIWSKCNTNSVVRNQLYASIGFHQIPVEKSIEFPIELYQLKMTNPDAPLVMKYYINLKKLGDSNEKIYKCTPILYASRTFDANFSTNFFRYLTATTLILDDITYEPLQPLEYLSYQQASNFYDQIGNNTHYIIHPEEILADNFVLWMTAEDHSTEVNTPAIVQKINDIISRAFSTTHK